MDRYRIQASNAELIQQWLVKRGGVQVWNCLSLAEAGKEFLSPLRDADGVDNDTKPHWSAGNVIRVLTRADEIEVVEKRLVKRFRVGVRRGDQGMSLKVTDGGSRRIRREIAKAGDDAWHEFDYATQEALIFAPSDVKPLELWTP